MVSSNVVVVAIPSVTVFLFVVNGAAVFSGFTELA